VFLPIPGMDGGRAKDEDADYTDRLKLLPASHYTASNVGRETLRLAAVSSVVVEARQAIRGSRGGSAFYHASSHRPSLSDSGVANLAAVWLGGSRVSV
jgi:hypothetical protein